MGSGSAPTPCAREWLRWPPQSPTPNSRLALMSGHRCKRGHQTDVSMQPRLRHHGMARRPMPCFVFCVSCADMLDCIWFINRCVASPLSAPEPQRSPPLLAIHDNAQGLRSILQPKLPVGVMILSPTLTECHGYPPPPPLPRGRGHCNT